MTTLSDIFNYLEIYLSLYPGERERLAIFMGYMKRVAEGSQFDRKNFEGHLTTSAFIILAETEEILLLRHKSLNRWLQPGGHMEGDCSLLASAIREAVEETGIEPAHMLHLPVQEYDSVPFDIDVHYIPENPRKMEEGHYHYDFRYLFSYSGEGTVAYNPDESTGLKWVKFDSLVHDETFGPMITKIRQRSK
ncbi:MAG: NUDIX hydrolase [Taibaiella sp.]|nr:NUDIX hydrolase [Taibaiella sp.]